MKPEANLLRELPSVDRVLTHPAAAPLLERYSRPFVTETLRGLLDDLRQAIKSGHDLPPDRLQDEFIITDLKKKLVRASRPGMVRVVNASGTILHTNLGRALLSEAAAEAVAAGRAPPRQPGVRPSAGQAGPAGRGDRVAAPRTDRGRGRGGGEQQRRGGAAGPQLHGRGQERHRLPRRADRDRRLVPHSGGHGQERRRAERGGHHQPHPPAGLRRGHRREHRAAAQGAHQQLPGGGLLGGGGAEGPGGHRPGAWGAGDGGPGQRRAGGPVGAGTAAGAAGWRARGPGRGRGHLQRRQDPGRSPGRLGGRREELDRPHEPQPAQARRALRQAHPGGTGSDPAELCPVSRPAERDPDPSGLQPASRRDRGGRPEGAAAYPGTARSGLRAGAGGLHLPDRQRRSPHRGDPEQGHRRPLPRPERRAGGAGLSARRSARHRTHQERSLHPGSQKRRRPRVAGAQPAEPS